MYKIIETGTRGYGDLWASVEFTSDDGNVVLAQVELSIAEEKTMENLQNKIKEYENNFLNVSSALLDIQNNVGVEFN